MTKTVPLSVVLNAFKEIQRDLYQPRKHRRISNSRELVDNYIAHFHGLQHLVPEDPATEPNWKRFMPSFDWTIKCL